MVLGVHEPTHAPPAHAWFEHATALLHWPFAPQVWTPFPEHVVVPGMHTPPHAPLTHVNWQALARPHVPEAVHVATPLVGPPSPAAAQDFVPGAHTPWHDAPLAPSTHAWLPQSTGLPQEPALQVWTPLPEHCEVPGAQTPWHSAPMHVPVVQGTAAPQLPVASHVCRPPFDEH